MGRRLLAVTAIVLAGQASAQDSFFGPSQTLEIEPEVDAYWHLNPDLRFQLQIQPQLVPADGYSAVLVGGFAEWLVAAPLRSLVNPDLAKTRALSLRFGVTYTQDVDAGSRGSTQLLTVQEEVTPRYFLPLDVSASIRNRIEGRWEFAAADEFSFRYQARFRVEREFAAGRTGFTPFAHVEWIWQSPHAQWQQFVMEGGLQVSFGEPGHGHVLEVNYQAATNLQPGRSWQPVLGVVWYAFF